MAARYGEVELASPPAPDEPVRVGIVSGFFFQHSVWKVGARGWVTQLDPKQFQIFGYSTNLKNDGETELARKHCHRFVEGPHSLERWRDIIAADRPHILLYPEIGMFHQVAEIAALRLAPVQCSTIGHPQTSGYPTIDYFLSGELIEPTEGDAHYSEKLVRLPNIGFHYEPLELAPAVVTREELGTPPVSDGLLVCAIAVQISAAARRSVPPHRARSGRLSVRVHRVFPRGGGHGSVQGSA